MEFVRDQRGAMEIVGGKVRPKISAMAEDRALLREAILSKDFSSGQHIFPCEERLVIRANDF